MHIGRHLGTEEIREPGGTGPLCLTLYSSLSTPRILEARRVFGLPSSLSRPEDVEEAARDMAGEFLILAAALRGRFITLRSSGLPLRVPTRKAR